MGRAASYAAPPTPTSPLDYMGRRGEIKLGLTGLIQWDGTDWVPTPLSWDSDTELVTLPSGLLVNGNTELGSLHVTGSARVDGVVSANDALNVAADLTVGGKASAARLQRGSGNAFGSNQIRLRSSTGYTHNSTGNWVDVPWDTVTSALSDEGTILQPGNVWMQANVTGFYLAWGITSFTANGTGKRGFRWVTDAGFIIGQGLLTAADVGGLIPSAPVLTYLTAGAQIRAQTYQDSGGNLAHEVDAAGRPFNSAFIQLG